MAYGPKEGFVDNSKIRRTISGDIDPLERNVLRTAEWKLDFATSSEMYGTARKIDYNQGVSKDVLFIPDLDDTDYIQERYIYGTMDSLPPITLPFYGQYSKSYNITEIAA